MLEIELNESLRRRREELRGKIESLGEAEAGDASAAETLDAKTRELRTLNTSIDGLHKRAQGMSAMRTCSVDPTNSFPEMEKEVEKLTARLQEERNSLEKLQSEQAEDSRGVSKQQKNMERYLAKRTMLLNRKDECNRNIRDLGVLPEEAFEKYTHEKLDRVCSYLMPRIVTLSRLFSADEKAAYCQRGS